MKTWKQIQHGEISDPTPGQGSLQVEETPDASTLLPLPIETLLPDVRVSTNALVVRRQRQKLYDHILCSYSDAHRRVNELVGIASQACSDPNDENNQWADAEASRMSPALLNRKRSEIALAHGQDALEAVRAKLGLDTLRDELLARLRESLSPERALDLLSAWTKEQLGKPCDTVRDANELFPHLTLSELAFVSLLEHLPSKFLYYGTTFDPTKVAKKTGLNAIAAGAQRRVPQQGWGTVQGIAYVLDDYVPQVEDKGIDESDPYSLLGFTGIRENVELVPFTGESERIVRALIPLMLSNSRLYERVWISSTESLQVGFGRIAALAFERTIGPTRREPAGVTLSEAIGALNTDERKEFEEERRCLEQTVVRASVYDLGRDMMLRPDEVVRLLGILDSVPSCLIREHPFTGFIQPYGASLKFISPDGSIIEQCPMSPLHQREAMETLRSEMNDAGRENRTIAHLFRELFSCVHRNVMDRFSEDEESLSLLEATALKLWLERRVVLLPLPVCSLVAVRDFEEHIKQYITTGKDVVARMTAKIGLQEAQQIATTLRIPANRLLERVNRVVKMQNAPSLASVTEGMALEGAYDSCSRTITLMESPEMLYGDIPPVRKAARSLALLHECGEAVWGMLDNTVQGRWKRISWPRGVRQRLQKHFLTFYAFHKDEKEDFCEHFSCYLFHGPEFRTAAASAGPLRRKYRMLRRIIGSILGSPVEYPRVTPWKIRDIHGPLWKEPLRVKLTDAVAFEEGRIARTYGNRIEHIFEIRRSLEQLLAEEHKRTDAEDIEDPVERQFVEDEDEYDGVDYDDDIVIGDGWFKIHEIRAFVTEALDSAIRLDEPKFCSLHETVTECLLQNNWDGIETSLDFLVEDDVDEVLTVLRQIDIGSGQAKHIVTQ